MAIDRAAALRNAEKFVKQGKLDHGIAEYVRLLEESPDDWSLTNSLGDLYVKNEQSEKAVECYARVADNFFAGGFLPKASALYRKILKLTPDSEHALLQSAEIATTQGLLVDARAHLKAVAALRNKRGDTAGATAAMLRVANLDPEDYDARLAGARALVERGAVTDAVALFQAIASELGDRGRRDDADHVLDEAAQADPSNTSLLLSLIEHRARDGRREAALAAAERLADISPAHRTDIVMLGLVFTETALPIGQALVAGCAERMAAERDYAGAAAAYESFLARAPHDDITLTRLIDIAIDGDLGDVLTRAQSRLAELRLSAGQAAQARLIAEDLVFRHPDSDEYRELLRRILATFGETLPDSIGRRPIRSQPDSPDSRLPAINDADGKREADGELAPAEQQPRTAAPSAPQDAASASSARATAPPIHARAHDVEVDLSLLLDQILKPVEQPPAPPELDDVFAEMREQARRRLAIDAAEQDFRKGVALFQAGQIDDCLAPLEAAARAPRFRFDAASLLGRIFLRRGDLTRAIEWLDRAADAPARTAEDGQAVLYDLAEALESTGDNTRALALYLQIEADVAGFRDVPERVERLSGLKVRR